MRVLTLIEDSSASEKLFAEHGLSFYIEHRGFRLLFDMGASDAFAKNAGRIRGNVDLKKLNAAVLTHNHTAHSGGLDELFRIVPDIKVFARQTTAAEFTKKVGVFHLPISLQPSYFHKHRDNFVLFNAFSEIAPGMFLMSADSRQTSDISNPLYVKRGGKYIEDDFSHEIFMTVFLGASPEDGVAVVTGCAHAGIPNVLQTVKNAWPSAVIRAVVGGFHMTAGKNILLSGEKIDATARYLRDNVTSEIYTCHCTGEKVYGRLKGTLGDQIQYLRAGEIVEFN